MLKKNLLKVFILVTALAGAQAINANPVITVPAQPQAAATPTPPSLNLKGYILMDANSGKVLAEKNADMRMAPASLTKLMSMYVISGALKNSSVHLQDKVRISKKAWETGGSRMFVKVDDEVPVSDLIQGIIVASGNDATVAMAEYIAGSEVGFTSMMNTTAKALGMNNSHFTDSNGLPNPGHYSTPRDLATLARAIIKDYPEDYRLYSQKWIAYHGIRQPNRNRLLWHYPLADGLKTGHTDDAGYCLVSSAVNKEGMRLIGVVMGANSDQARTEDSIRLLTYGFRFYETHKLYGANTALAQARVWKGQSKETPLGLTEDFYITLPAGQYKNVQASIELTNPVKAPIVKGQPYGLLKITLNNEVLATQPLVALTSNPKGGLIRNLADSINFNFHKMFSHSTDKVDNA